MVDLNKIELEAKEKAKEGFKKSIESTKPFSFYMNPNVSETNFPELNLNGVALIEDELGSISDLSIDRISNIRIILWAVCNQDNPDIFNWTKMQRDESIRVFGESLKLDKVSEYMKVIKELFSMGGNPVAPEKKGPIKKAKMNG